MLVFIVCYQPPHRRDVSVLLNTITFMTTAVYDCTCQLPVEIISLLWTAMTMISYKRMDILAIGILVHFIIFVHARKWMDLVSLPFRNILYPP